jgi:hypothetical protein
MTAKEIITAALDTIGITQATAAKNYGGSAQQLSQRIVRGSLRVDEFIGLMDSMGIDITFNVRDTGEEIKPRISGHGDRVKGFSDGVQYDTEYAEALSNSFYADGQHEYNEKGEALELYLDKEGRYFMAEYSNVEGARNRVRSVPAEVAAAFIEKYGNIIEKNINVDNV